MINSHFKIHKLTLVLSVIIVSCNNSPNFMGVEDLSDINEEVIKEFYYSVLDTIIADRYLMSKTRTRTILTDKLFNIEGADKNDQDFFKSQVEKFDTLMWEDIIQRDLIFNDSIHKDIFRSDLDPTDSWRIYHERYDPYCLCSVTIPLFSLDFKRAYIEIWEVCNFNLGYGENFFFEYIDDKWKMTGKQICGEV